jgi:hypothetical protein
MPDDIVSRSRSVIRSNRGSRAASSGRYLVTGSEMLPISPSSTAIPTRVDRTDLATEKEVCRVWRPAPWKYRS